MVRKLRKFKAELSHHSKMSLQNVKTEITVAKGKLSNGIFFRKPKKAVYQL